MKIDKIFKRYLSRSFHLEFIFIPGVASDDGTRRVEMCTCDEYLGGKVVKNHYFDGFCESWTEFLSEVVLEYAIVPLRMHIIYLVLLLYLQSH